MIKGKKKVDFWYYYIHSKLKERSSSNLLRLEEAKSFLFEWRIPKSGRMIILIELEHMGLIERVDKDTIRIKASDFPVDNVSAVYDMMGLLEE